MQELLIVEEHALASNIFLKNIDAIVYIHIPINIKDENIESYQLIIVQSFSKLTDMLQSGLKRHVSVQQ